MKWMMIGRTILLMIELIRVNVQIIWWIMSQINPMIAQSREKYYQYNSHKVKK